MFYCYVWHGVDILIRLNLSVLQSRRRHLDALLFANIFGSQFSWSSNFDTLRIPTGLSRDCPVFEVFYPVMSVPQPEVFVRLMLSAVILMFLSLIGLHQGE
jgi:hypothetical protein